MNLFGRKAAGRDDARPALEFRRARFVTTAVGDVPQTYEAQLRALYLRNAIAQRAVRMVADGVGDAPIVAAPAIVALVQARSAGQALTATVAAQLLLHGNAYATGATHYFSGFVLRPDQFADWRDIDAAAQAAQGRGVARSFIWALPQVLRDGFVHFDQMEDGVDAFDDVLFPLALGREAEVAPQFSTAIVTSAGGHEARNASWAEARTRYDVGPGVRSEADIATLLGFFRARMGPARGFRLRDPFDFSSGGAVPTAGDQMLGSGDAVAVRYALVKQYGDAVRRITRPVAGSVRVALGGVATSAFSLVAGGFVELDTAPGVGVAVTAGFLFDVPVRFAEDTLDISRATFLAGTAPSVPLIEVREG